MRRWSEVELPEVVLTGSDVTRSDVIGPEVTSVT